MKFSYIFLASILLYAGSSCSNDKLTIKDTQCEGIVNPLGIDNTQPRFSWKMACTKNGEAQTAYEILVSSDSLALTTDNANLWSSSKIMSENSVYVPYQGKSLSARHLYYWKVRVWDKNDHVSQWSSIARFSIGILNNDIQGKYIGLSAEAGDVTSPILRKSITYDEISKSLLHVNSLGCHEVYVNGQKVGDKVLAPAVSMLNKRSLIITYDITPYLAKGNNDILIWLGKGWNIEHGFKMPGDGPIVKAELDVLKDGEVHIIAQTDETWQGIESGYTTTGDGYPHQFGGDAIDARKTLPDFTAATLNKQTWHPVVEIEVPNMVTTPQMFEGNHIEETIVAKNVAQVDDTTWVADLGRNMNGWISIQFPKLSAGQKIKLEYADRLNDNGEVHFPTVETDFYIASGKGNETFCNKFNSHAFRYVKISNLSEKLEPNQIKGLQIQGEYADATTFKCSDNDINAIHDMIKYTIRNLTFNGYMVDCPHIERGGYGGDGNASTISLQTMFNANSTYSNWLLAWQDAIQEDGGLPHAAPLPYRCGGGPYWCGFIIEAPWRTYLNYNDKRIMERNYPLMKRWLGYVDKYSIDGLLKRWPDEEYRQWYLGDWVAPKGTEVKDPESIDIINNCAVSQFLGDIAQVARVLGHDDEAAEFEKKKESLNKLIHQTFYHEDTGIYASGSQIDMAYPMLVGAVPAHIYKNVANKLKELTRREHNGHLACGLVGIPILTEWTVKNKEADFMYQMLKQRDYPGYLYMIDNGATTTWEEWHRNTRSSIHNCYNGIGSWFYQAIGGITPDKDAPAYRHINIDPQIPSGMTWAEVSKETPYGTIGLKWELNDDKLTYSIEIPIGSTATVKIPGNATAMLLDGKRHDIKDGQLLMEAGKHRIVFHVKTRYESIYDSLADVGQYMIPSIEKMPKFCWEVSYPSSLKERILTASISGLANKALMENKTVFGVWISNPRDGQTTYQAEKERLKNSGCKFIGPISPITLATQDQEDIHGTPVDLRHLFSGYILTDIDNNPESATYATNAAWEYNALIVDKSLQDIFDKAGYKMLCDASTKTVRDAWNDYKDKSSKKGVVVMTNDTWEQKDWAIQNKFFYMSMYPRPHDNTTDDYWDIFNEAVARLENHNYVYGWEFGIHSEHEINETASKNAQATAIDDWFYNHSMTNVQYKQQQELVLANVINPKDIDYNKNKRFVSFFMTDGDNNQWMMGGFVPDWYDVPESSQNKVAFGIAAATMPQMAPAAYKHILNRQPAGSTLVEVQGGGVYYSDTYGNNRDRKVLLKEKLEKTSAYMRQHRIKVGGLMARDSVGSPEAKEAYQTFIETNDQLIGIVALQYTPYAGGKGDIYWYKNKLGLHIPVISIKYSLWNEPMIRPREGTPKFISKQLDNDQNNPDFNLIAIHCWSSFSDQGTDCDDLAETKSGNLKGSQAASLLANHLNDSYEIVSLEELIWQLRMRNYPEETRKYIDSLY